MGLKPPCQEASVFVCLDVTSPPSCVQWNAALGGGQICAQEYVVSQTGPCLTFEPAMKSHRIIWMTDAFITANPNMADATIHRTYPKNKWVQLFYIIEFNFNCFCAAKLKCLMSPSVPSSCKTDQLPHDRMADDGCNWKLARDESHLQLRAASAQKNQVVLLCAEEDKADQAP